MKEKEFDRVVKEKLEGINNTPPAYMWDRIATNIPVATTSSVVTSGGISTSIKLMVIAASLIIVSGISYLIFHNEKTEYRSRIENNNYSKGNYKLKHRAANNKTTVTEKEELIKEFVTVKESVNPNTNINSREKKDSNKPAKQFQNEIDFTDAQKHVLDSISISNKMVAPILSDTKLENNASTEPEVKIAPESLVIDNKADQINVNTEASSANEVQLVKTVVVSERLENNTEASATNTQNESQTTETSEAPTAEKIAAVEQNDSKEATKAQGEDDQSAIKLDNPKFRQLKAYSIGLHYGPEFMDVDGMKLTDHAVDFSFNYQNYNFIFQTGLGFKLSTNRVAYNMKYKRWDYLETQVRFDSAIIVLDPNGKPIITPVDPYYVEVYDSLTHNYSATATEQNLILQLPILVGYQVDFDKFAYFIKGGVRYSLIVYKNTKDLMKIDEQSHLVQMNYPNQKRATSNIDYELAIGGAYKLNKNIQIQLELFGRYYHYSIFEENPPSGIHPWSLSGRVGLIYKVK